MIQTVKNDGKRIILCVLAGVMMSVNYNTFVHTGGLLPGGFAGMTLLIQSISRTFFHYNMPYGPVYILANLFPIILSYRKIGKKFTIFSCVTIGTVAVLTDLIPSYVITQDILLISIFGGMINGTAIMLCLMAGATSGGTDFISIYVSEKFHIDAWNYVLMFNGCILVVDGFLFGWDKALYSIIFQFVTTQILNARYMHYKKTTLFIVTEYPDEIARALYKKTKHGATTLDAQGTYQGTPRKMLYTVINAEEINKVLKIIDNIDDKAFVNVIRTEQLRGAFYMRPKD
ncbi:MAG: YitT family protein [Lachnospiraceae bacterium]|nr:YitT family protein [Lachnospiraceae bacterium]MBQ5386787.1 YitT family protein [Lachnospiraceae bacterium]MBR0430573.1 YitT family protein [Lachnospiraceae bacterium]